MLDRNLPRSLALAGALLAACSGGSSHHGGGGGGGGGGHHPGPIVLTEIEPNDNPHDADFLGFIDRRSHLIVEGHVQGFGGWDTIDFFELVADEPMELGFSLYGFELFADLDLCVYDPELDLIVACFESPWNPEEGSFVIHEYGRVFQVFVDAHGADTAYDLELIGFPYPGPLDAGASAAGTPPAITALGATSSESRASEDAKGAAEPDERLE